MVGTSQRRLPALTDPCPEFDLPFDPLAGGDDGFLLALSDACGAPGAPEAVLELAAAALGRRLGADRVDVAAVGEGGADHVARWADETASPATERRQGPHPDLATLSAPARGETVVIHDHGPASADGGSRATLRSRAIIRVPGIRDGVLVGQIEVTQAGPRRWTDAEVRLVERAATRTWRALEHLSALTRLRDSEAQFRTLAESLPSFCWLGDAQGRPFWHNRRALEYADAVGIDPNDMTAMCHPDEIPDIIRNWSTAIAAGRALEMSVRIRGPGGTWLSSLSQARPVHDAEGRVIRWCGVITDLSEQRAAEARRDFLMTLADRLRAETDVGVYIEVTAGMLGRHLGVSRVCYSEIDPDDPRVFQVEREWNDGSVPDVVGRHRLETLGDGLVRSHLEGRTLIVEDIDTHPLIGAEAAPVLRRLGFVSGIDTPLVKGGRLAAILHVHASAPRRWTDDEIALVKEVADRTWSGVERAKAESHLEAQERDQRFLLALSDATRDVLDPREILGTTLAALGEHLGVSRANYAEADASGAALEVIQDWVDGLGSVAGGRFPFEALGEAVLADHLTGQPFRTDDVDGDARFRTDLMGTYRAVGVRAFISVPLVRAGRLQAVLSVQCAAPRRWSEREVRLMQEVAERHWATLQRARSEERLRDSEEQFRTLAENLPDVCFVADAHGRMLWANRAFHVVFGPDVGLLAPEDLPKVVDPRDVDRAGALWARALASGEPYDDRLRLMDATGVSRPFRTQTRPVRDSQGRIVRWCGVLTDLSEEAARADRQAFVFGLAERLREERDPDLILAETARALGRRLGADRAYFAAQGEGAMIEILGGWARDGLEPHAGRHDFGAFGPEALAQHRAGRTTVLSDVHRQIHDEAALAAFARYEVEAIVTAPLLLEGRLAGFLTLQSRRPRRWVGEDVDLIRDAAERGWAAWNRAVAEADLGRSRAALAQSEKLTALGSLLAGVSHELNNPLSIIVAQSVMLERQAGDGSLAVRAQKIRAAADRCARIVQTFLAMARQRPPRREAVDLNEIVASALDLTEYGLRADGVALRRELTSEPTALSADGDQLHQVILNLVTNAQQAMADLDGERILTLRTSREGDALLLDVIDTGPGVPGEIAARVFEPFFTTKPQGEGTGFGLPFSHGIALAHDGDLKLMDHEGGAWFRLRLTASGADVGAASGVSLAARGPRARRRALVIDDEREIAESLADLLDLAGFDCEIAHGGRAATARLAEPDAWFDLVLSDIRMPDLNGPAVFDWIRASRPDLVDRTAFATGDTLGADASDFLGRAGRPHIEKPVTPEALAALLSSLGLETAP